MNPNRTNRNLMLAFIFLTAFFTWQYQDAISRLNRSECEMRNQISEMKFTIEFVNIILDTIQDDITEKIVRHEARLDNLNASIVEILDEMPAHKVNDHGALNQRITALEDYARLIEAEIDVNMFSANDNHTILYTLDDITVKLNSLQNQLSEQASLITTHTGYVIQYHNQIGTLQNQVEALKNAVTTQKD